MYRLNVQVTAYGRQTILDTERRAGLSAIAELLVTVHESRK